MNLLKVFEWLETNKLSMNIDETKLMLFHPYRANENLPQKLPLLSLEGLEIRQVSSAKFLGFQTDEIIIWEEQITLMQNKVSK